MEKYNILKMTIAQVAELQQHLQQSYSGLRSPRGHTHPTYEMTPGFKPFTILEKYVVYWHY